ncbi:MAG: CHASE domain-containing protein [Bdellovibrionota bacterium]
MKLKKIFPWDNTFFVEGTKLIFILSIVALLGAGSWWLVKSFVETDLNVRLEHESLKIESTIRERFETYVNSLVHIRSSLLIYGIPSRDQYRKTTHLLELGSRYPGIQGIGIAQLVQKNEMNEYNIKNRKELPGFSVKPPGVREFYAPLTMVEPNGWRNQAILGYDLLSDYTPQQVIRDSISTGLPVLSAPMNLELALGAPALPGFLLVLPFYKSVETPQTFEERNQLAHGLIVALFNGRTFFEGTFGSPSLKNEIVNFRVESLDQNAFRSKVYERFDMPEPGGRVLHHQREIEVYGQKWKISLTTLPHFFTQEDKYTPLIVAIVSFFILLLIMLIFMTTVKQLRAEKVKNDAVIEKQIISRDQIRKLRKLNELSRKVSDASEMDQLIGIYFVTILDLDGSTHGFLYFSDDNPADKRLHLHNTRGFQDSNFVKPSLEVVEAQFMLSNQNYLRRNGPDSDSILGFFLKQKQIPKFSDWLVFGIPSREDGNSGILFLGRTDGKLFSETDVEFVESFTSQTGISIDNLKLFRRAQDSSHSKSSFLANMSHEIRTPLNAIIGFSEILFRDEATPEHRGHLIENIKKNGLQLTRIIDDILDISKVEAGRLVVDLRRTSLANLINEVHSVMCLRSQQKGIEFRVRGRGKLPDFIDTDEVRLKQILMNLAGNAIKFTESGYVDLIVEFVQDREKQNMITFSIQDSGIGMSPDQEKNLFQPFSQADATATRKFGGTGLGLSISRKLAQQLGGDIEVVYTELGKGSMFRAWVKAGDLVQADWQERAWDSTSYLNSEETCAGSFDAKRLADKKILVVEDSEDNQGIFEFFLKHAGADVEIVDNGLDAVKRADEGNFDLILMDIQIPLIDGKEATRRIRAHGFEKPIVALTAHAMPEEKESCYAAGCNGQITKPVSGEDFVLRVSHYLEGANDI